MRSLICVYLCNQRIMIHCRVERKGNMSHLLILCGCDSRRLAENTDISLGIGMRQWLSCFIVHLIYGNQTRFETEANVTRRWPSLLSYHQPKSANLRPRLVVSQPAIKRIFRAQFHSSSMWSRYLRKTNMRAQWKLPWPRAGQDSDALVVLLSNGLWLQRAQAFPLSGSHPPLSKSNHSRLLVSDFRSETRSTKV